MSQKMAQITRPPEAAFVVQHGSATKQSTTQFDETRRNRVAIANPKGGFAISPKDGAPGVMLIGVAVAEAIFVEPIRSIRRRLLGL